jgi:hypothetical protein
MDDYANLQTYICVALNQNARCAFACKHALPDDVARMMQRQLLQNATSNDVDPMHLHRWLH